MKVISPNTLPTTLAGFARASTATYVDDAGVLQTAGVNVPRWERGRLLVEGAATNYCTSNNATSPTKFTGLGGDGTITLLSDPFWPVVLRITKTTGGAGARVGIRWPVAAIADDEYTVGIWVRRPAAVIDGYAVYSDMTKVAGGFVSASKGLPLVPPGVWFRSAATASEGGASYSGGYLYAWVEGAIGDYIDVALPCAWAGASDSSAIVTGASPATRAADVLTGAGLLYSSATDATAAYVAGTTYAAGAQVAYDRSRYQSLQAANVGHTPDVSPTWWARLGPVNPWAMFDDQVSTQTAGTAPLRVSFEAGAFDSLAVLAVDAATVTLVVTDGAGGPEVYRRTVGMGADVVTNWYEYFYADLDYRRTQVLFAGVPLMGSAVAHLEVTGSGTVRVGHVAWGRMKPVGNVRYGVRAGIRDFSRKDTDDLGVTTFVRRANSKTLTAQLEVEKAELNRTQNLLTALRATPVVWVGSDDPSYSDLMVVFGFYRDFYGSVDYPTKAIYSLEIEGLT